MTRSFTLAVVALLPMLARGEGYICISDIATGFVYENGGWQLTRFKPDQKLIVRSPTYFDRRI